MTYYMAILVIGYLIYFKHIFTFKKRISPSKNKNKNCSTDSRLPKSKSTKLHPFPLQRFVIIIFFDILMLDE